MQSWSWSWICPLLTLCCWCCSHAPILQAGDVTPGVQSDADVILVLDRSLLPAAAGWPRTHAFPGQPQVGAGRVSLLLAWAAMAERGAWLAYATAHARLPRVPCIRQSARAHPVRLLLAWQGEQLTSFVNLLLKEWWKHLPADEQQRQVRAQR